MCGTLILFVLFINYKDIFVFAQNLALTEADNNPKEGSPSVLSNIPPQGNDPWIHSVIFEPLPKIQLTYSSYQGTTLLDFQPFLKGFEQVKIYIDQFK